MPVGWQNRDWAEVRSSPFGFCRVRGFIKMSECQIHGTRIAYFRAEGVLFCARTFSRVGEKAECKPSGVFPVFCFAFMSNHMDRCGLGVSEMSQSLSVCFFVFGNKMSSNSVFRMLEILFGERLGLGFKSCGICFPFVLRTSENRFQPNDFSIS